MKYTQEQLGVIQCEADTLIANAFAGTGKTSTLVGYASARPRRRILYLAYNTSLAAEARTRFPSNVDARTPHSLAFAAFGASYRHKLGSPRALDVVDFLTTALGPAGMGRDKYFFAQCVLRRINEFFGSADNKLDVPAGAFDDMITSKSGEAIDYQKVIAAAKLVWAGMQDKDDTKLSMPHDGYLKLFQLSAPNLSRYDTILLDEAQDTNPCLLHIFKTQRSRKVVVGDRHQNIYGFRQSINAMQHLEGERHNLTSSFRFGPDVAEVANAILGVFCGEMTQIEGLGKDASPIKSTCYLHRTNSGLFDRAVELVNKHQSPHFLGGVSNYNFDAITDTWRLHSGLKDIRDPFLRRFGSYTELAEYAEAIDDRELKGRMKVVKEYGASIPRYVQQLSQMDATPENSDATLSTAHKAKGQEWDLVVMGDDFPEMMAGDVPLTPSGARKTKEKALGVEEANLIYVAATRARKELVQNRALSDFTEWATAATY